MPETAWPYPLIERGSKVGVHAIRSNRVTEFARTLVAGGAAFPVVKAVDDLGWLPQIKAISPRTVIVARQTSRYEGCERVGDPSTDLDEMADNLVGVVLEKLQRHPELRDVVDYWEISNEPDPPGAEGYRRLALLMIKCMERAEAEGLKLGLFGLNAGTPEWPEIEAMVETGVFGRARRGGHILTLHEGVFGNVPIDRWWGDPIPGAPRVEGAGALCFRYRYLYHLLRQRGEVIPLVVSEFYAGGGYAQDGVAPEAIVERMAWYDEKARQDYWVLAFCPFTLGPVGQWVNTDYEFVYPALVDYMLTVKEKPNGQPEAVAPTPTPEEPPAEEPEEEPQESPRRGAPRVQYRRTYVLLPPDADSTWARAVVEATWDERRFTVGSSADDAGIGDLDDRTVIAVNPSRWPTDLKTFFDTYYPGVRYIPVEAATPAQLVSRLRAL
ncbi:MAG TPA: hypothetical protein ENK56_06110 [Chloroflexi bacterium]|nr:hypothetical protein [Chloroflexota bacterium]